MLPLPNTQLPMLSGLSQKRPHPHLSSSDSEGEEEEEEEEEEEVSEKKVSKKIPLCVESNIRM